MLDSVDQLKAANPLVDTWLIMVRYTLDTDFGNQMQNLGRLIKADLGLEVASVDIGGWDHHDNLDNELPPLCTDFADTMAAFYTDMGDRMANITVIAMTEFGRRVQEKRFHGH